MQPNQTSAQGDPQADGGEASSVRSANGPSADAGAAVPSGAKSKRWRLVAFGALGLALAGACGTLVYTRYFSARARRALPVVAQRLPAHTQRVADTRLRSDLDELATLPPAYVTSALAAVACGGTDVGSLMAKARGKDLAWLKKNGVLDVAQRVDVRAALRCGAALANGLASPSVVEVAFAENNKTFHVSALRSTAQDLPSELGFVRHNFSGMPGQCLRPKDAKTDCPEGTSATFRDDQTRVFGQVAEVEAFARAYTTAHEELTTTVDILQSTVQHTRGADDTFIVAKPETVPWKLVCERAAPVGHETEFVEACFPSGQEKLLESIATKVRGLAVERDILAKGAAFSVSYVLLTRDEDAARDVEKDLLDLARD